MMAPGHMIPLVDTAGQFARHDGDVKATVIITPLNAAQFSPTTSERESAKGIDVQISSEQFDNEKFVTDILRMGVAVGAHEWSKGTRI